MLIYLWIGLGSALGGMARCGVVDYVSRHWGVAYPYGTLWVNVSGSFLIGFFAALTGVGGSVSATPTGRQFFMAGICGGYTTFSAFSLQTLELIQKGEWPKAGINVVFSVGFCMIAVWLGYVLAMYFNRLKGT